MPIDRGSWWNSGSPRPIMKVGGGVTADVEQDDIASCAINAAALAALSVTSGKLAAGAVTCFALADAHVTSGKLAAAAVTCTALGAGHVVSEKASCGLQRRSYSFTFSKATSTEAGGEAAVGTTAIEVWRPSVAINVLGFDHMPIGGKYQNATCDNFTLYANAGTCLGHVALKAVSTGISRGVRTAGSGLTQVALAADTPIFVKLFTSTCSETVDSLFTIHYTSTN